MRKQFNIAIGIAAIFLSACAQVVSPTGGEKDILPPKVTDSKPENGSTNFNAKEIVITFDEYIQLGTISEELNISPPLNKKPDITIKGKSLSIKISDTLSENTTYTFSFGSSIKDNNEGNILENYTYAFSTGAVIDSLSASGIVLDAFTIEPKEKFLVMLYENLGDSVPYKELPRYITRTNKSGEFKFQNLKEGTYRLFALEDKNRNSKFDQANETIAFQEESLKLNSDTSGLKLFSFLEDKTRQFLVKNSYSKGKLTLIYNRPTQQVDLQPLDATFQNQWFIKEQSKEGDTVSYLFLIPDSTSFKAEIKADTAAPDTIELKINTKKELDSLLKPTTSVPSGSFNISKSLRLMFPTPIKVWDPLLVSLMKDSVPVPFEIELTDSLAKTVLIKADLKEATTYQINILPKAFVDVYARTTDTLSSNFTTTELKDYGNLSVTINSMDSANLDVPMILQLVNAQKKIINEKRITNGSSVQFRYLDAGNYSLKVIFDKNRNGKWDTGNFILKQLPEKTALYEGEIIIRSNWDKKIAWKIKR